MKKVYLCSGISTIMILIIYLMTLQYEAIAQPDGISGYSSAKSSCNICHSGIAAIVINNENAMLTSNIPTTGYLPGTTYDMILTIKTQKPRVGFDLRGQDGKGAIIGTSNNVTNGRVLNGEVVHNGTNGVTNGQKIITFKWLAPIEGTGDVTFFGSIAINPSSTESMDTLNKINVIFQEDQTVGLVYEYLTQTNDLSISPTLVQDQFEVQYRLYEPSYVQIFLYNAQGSMIGLLYEGAQSVGNYAQPFSSATFQTGMYTVHTRINHIDQTTKIIVQK